MKEFIVTGSQSGRPAKVRVFARDAGQAVKIAFDEHGFTAYSSVDRA